MKHPILFATALAASFGIASAQIHTYDWVPGQPNDPVGVGGNDLAWKSLSVSYNENTNRINFSSTLDNSEIVASDYGPNDPAGPHSWGMINFVVTNGPTPDNQSNPATHTVFTLDYNQNNPLFSVSEYNLDLSVGGQLTPVQTAFRSLAVTDNGSLRTFDASVSLDGNSLLQASAFTDTVGLWARAWADYETGYQGSELLKYRPVYLQGDSFTNTAFWDVGNVKTTPVPEPSSALLALSAGSLAFLRRRR